MAGETDRGACSGGAGEIEGTLSAQALAAARLPLERAATLPREAYVSPEVYAREVERIFRREWLCAGRVDQLPEPGSHFPLDLLGEKLVVTRDERGEVRVLSRVCRHRAAEVVTKPGVARSLRCPYHAWTYALDGRLLGAPLMDGVERFERAQCGLPEIRSEVWEGWIFVNFDPRAGALGPRLEPLRRSLAGFCMSEMVATEPVVFDSPFNWKVLVDNFMEAYHHIAVHRETLEPLFPGKRSHVPDNQGPYSLLIMPTAGDEPAPAPFADGPPPATLEDWQRSSLVAAVVYPFHLFAPGPDSLTWYQLLPETWDRFTLRTYTCHPRAVIADPAHADACAGLRAFVTTVHQEDIAACEAVWAGLGSPSSVPGRLSLLERAIWQFNQWWIDRMAERASPDRAP